MSKRFESLTLYCLGVSAVVMLGGFLSPLFLCAAFLLAAAGGVLGMLMIVSICIEEIYPKVPPPEGIILIHSRDGGRFASQQLNDREMYAALGDLVPHVLATPSRAVLIEYGRAYPLSKRAIQEVLSRNERELLSSTLDCIKSRLLNPQKVCVLRHGGAVTEYEALLKRGNYLGKDIRFLQSANA